MTGEVIKSFLVGLGFGVDDASLAKFNKALNSATLKVAALYTAIKLSAAGIFYSISKMSEGFEEVGYSLRLVAPAVNKMLLLRAAMLDAYKRAGIDLTKVVKESIAFNFSLAKTKFALEAAYKSVGARFIPLLTKQMDIFRAKIFANMPKIQAILEKFVKFIFKAFEATVQLGARLWSILGRVWDFFTKLDEATDGWSTKILLAVAAWKYLNLAFLASPIGMILTGLLALLALWDDFKTFQEGGASLINWGSETTKTILGIITVVAALASGIGAVVLALKAWAIGQAAVDALLLLNPIGLWITGITALIALITALAVKMGYLKGLGNAFSGLGGSVLNAFGGAGAGAALNSAVQPSPLVSGASNSHSQNVSQENNINIFGNGDHKQTAQSVGSAMSGSNADLLRNLGVKAQ